MTDPVTRPRDDSPVRPLFRSIVCGVDGSPSSLEAARQAAVLGGRDADISVLTVGNGLTRSSVLGEERAQAAVEQAADAVRQAGGQATERIVMHREPIDVLLEAAAETDLLVVSSHGRSARFGLLLGSTVSVLAHRAHVPVLIARRPPPGRSFPDSIIVASDGRPEADDAVELAGTLAARHGAKLALVHVEDGREVPGRQLAEHSVRLIELTGVEPVVLPEQGPADDRIVEAAERVSASLIVTGARSLGALGALGSVSERVAHHARCSVLIVRPR